MLAIKNILCPTDFSPLAQAAVPIACALARDYGASLTLLYVQPVGGVSIGEFGALPAIPWEPHNVLTERLHKLLPAHFSGSVKCCVRDGDAVEEILSAADLIAADLIVMGSHGRTGLPRLLVGSVAESVLRRARCPVLTIKPPTPEKAPQPVEHEPELEAGELVTVCSVANPVEAELIHNTLKNEGIGSFVEGARQAGIAGVLGFPVKIQVSTRDFNRASKLIQRQEEHRR